MQVFTPYVGMMLLPHQTTRWQCCSITELVLTWWLLQEKERVLERRRKIESKDWKQERDFSALYVAPSCSLAARRHLTLTLFVPTTPKVNDFPHYCKWCLVFTLSHRRNEYSRLLLSGCPEVRLYVKICPKTDREQSNDEDNNIAKTSVIMAQTAFSVCSQRACVLVKLLTRSSLPGHNTNNWPMEYQSQPCWLLSDTPKSQRGC